MEKKELAMNRWNILLKHWKILNLYLKQKVDVLVVQHIKCQWKLDQTEDKLLLLDGLYCLQEKETAKELCKKNLLVKLWTLSTILVLQLRKEMKCTEWLRLIRLLLTTNGNFEKILILNYCVSGVLTCTVIYGGKLLRN